LVPSSFLQFVNVADNPNAKSISIENLDFIFFKGVQS